MSDSARAANSDGKKKKRRGKNKKKGRGGGQAMDVQFSVDVPAADVTVKEAGEIVERTDAKQEEETLVVDVDNNCELSTTETVMEVQQTIEVDELPENVKEHLAHGGGTSSVTVTINGQEVELPPGMTLESLTEEDMAKLLPSTEGGNEDGGVRVVEVTETIISEEGNEDGEIHSQDVIVTTHTESIDHVIHEQSHDLHHHEHGHDVDDGETKYIIENTYITEIANPTADAVVDEDDVQRSAAVAERVELAVDVPTVEVEVEEEEAPNSCHSDEPKRGDGETLVIDVDKKYEMSTTETVMDVSQTVNVDELPEDVKEHLVHVGGTSNVTVTINGQEVELPPGVTLDSLTEEDMAKLVPSKEGGNEDGGVRIVEVTETIISEEGNEDSEIHSQDVVVTTHTTEATDHVIHDQPHGLEHAIENLIDNEETKKLEVKKVTKTVTRSSEEIPNDVIGEKIDIDVQTSPWKVDSEVEEILHHNKRVRLTKITKSRKVIITKTVDGEEIETVVEEEDDDENPEVIGEIGQFDDTTNETIEIQKVIKKRRIIIRKTADGKEIETVVGEDEGSEDDMPESERQVEKASIIRTRKVIITKNEFGEDVETVIEDEAEPVHLRIHCGGIKITEDVSEDVTENVTEDVTEVVTEYVTENAAPLAIDEEQTKLYGSPNVQDIAVTSETVECKPLTHTWLIKTEEIVDRDRSTDDGDAVDDVTEDRREIVIETGDQHEANVEIIAEDNRHPYEEVISEAVTTTIVESEVEYNADIPCHEHEHIDDERPESSLIPSTEGKEITFVDDYKHPEEKDDVNIYKVEESEKPQTKTFAPVNVTIQLNVTEKAPPQSKTKLTDEQRQMLAEMNMADVKDILGEWVLVDFTPKEVERFAELMRFKPGWTDESIEMQKCCKMM